MEAAHRCLCYKMTVDRRERHANRILCDMREEKRSDGVERLRNERRTRGLRNGYEVGSSSNPPPVVPPEVRRPRIERPPPPGLEDGRRLPHGRRPLVELLTEAEAHELIRTNTLVSGNNLLPEGWTKNIMIGVPVAPRLAGQAQLDYIDHIMAGRPELQNDPRYVPTVPYWDEQLDIEH